MKKSLIALAFGTLGLGIAEFVMMGILPDVAKDLGISIPVAGHFISAYALGVCVGAPVLTLARKYPLKHILLVLVTLIMIGNICAALSPNYWVLLAARFISGLPHGAYFGVGSIVAERLADKGKGSEAVSLMIGNFPQHYAFLACHFPVGRHLGNRNHVLHLALGSPRRRVERHRLQGAIPLPQNSGPVADSGCHSIKQRWCILLV